jgi:hypothetical protein
MARCWECESEASPTIEVILPIPDRGRLAVALCRACHRDVFSPLVTELIDAGHVGSSLKATGQAASSAIVW